MGSTRPGALQDLLARILVYRGACQGLMREIFVPSMLRLAIKPF